jgi:hypothetical protein
MKHLKIIEAVGQYDNKQGVISAIKNYRQKTRKARQNIGHPFSYIP